jgi:hypothetical protein
MFGLVLSLNVHIIVKSIDQENIGMEIMNQKMLHVWKLFMFGQEIIQVD